MVRCFFAETTGTRYTTSGVPGTIGTRCTRGTRDTDTKHTRAAGILLARDTRHIRDTRDPGVPQALRGTKVGRTQQGTSKHQPCTCQVAPPACTCQVAPPACTCQVAPPACTCQVAPPARTCQVAPPTCHTSLHHSYL